MDNINNLQVLKTQIKISGVGVERLCLITLEKYCRERFATSIKFANKQKIRPLIIYCIKKVGIENQAAARAIGVSVRTMQRCVPAGEFIAMKTPQGKKFYNEIMKLLTQTIRKKAVQTLADI